MPSKKCEVDDLLRRVGRMAVVKMPLAWTESTFYGELVKLSQIDNIDVLYEHFLPDLYIEITAKGYTVSEYLKKLMWENLELPLVNKMPFTQKRLAEEVNKIWKKLYEMQNDPELHQMLREAKMLGDDNKLSFKEAKPFYLFKIYSYKQIPDYTTRGIGIFLSLVILYLIDKGVLSGKGAETMKEVVGYYACISSRAIGVPVCFIWEILQRVTGEKKECPVTC